MLKAISLVREGFYKKYWLPHIPLFTSVAIAIVTLFVAFNSNIFDANNKLLEAKKVSLQNEIHDFQIIKNSLIKRNQVLEKKFDSVSSVVNTKIKQVEQINLQYRKIKNSKDSLSIQYNEQKRKIRAMSREVQSLIAAGDTKKANEKLNELIELLNKIAYRIFDKSFDETFE